MNNQIKKYLKRYKKIYFVWRGIRSKGKWVAIDGNHSTDSLCYPPSRTKRLRSDPAQSISAQNYKFFMHDNILQCSIFTTIQYIWPSVFPSLMSVDSTNFQGSQNCCHFQIRDCHFAGFHYTLSGNLLLVAIDIYQQTTHFI